MQRSACSTGRQHRNHVPLIAHRNCSNFQLASGIGSIKRWPNATVFCSESSPKCSKHFGLGPTMSSGASTAKSNSPCIEPWSKQADFPNPNVPPLSMPTINQMTIANLLAAHLNLPKLRPSLAKSKASPCGKLPAMSLVLALRLGHGEWIECLFQKLRIENLLLNAQLANGFARSKRFFGQFRSFLIPDVGVQTRNHR